MIILVVAESEKSYEAFISLIVDHPDVTFKYVDSPQMAEGWNASYSTGSNPMLITLLGFSLNKQWPAIKEGLKRSGFNI